jgi:3-hydroxybutyrate dehydrogenase
MTQLAISHFISRKKPGVITHISSIVGQKPFFPTPVYVATKHAISGFVRSLAQLETPPAKSSLPSIRVNAVAPGVIKTPLWVENKEKLKMIDENADEWVTPEEVAQVMVDLIEKEENVGGTILEVGKGKVRRVEAINDPGPEGSGHTVSNSESEEKEIWGRLGGRSRVQ